MVAATVVVMQGVGEDGGGLSSTVVMAVVVAVVGRPCRPWQRGWPSSSLGW